MDDRLIGFLRGASPLMRFIAVSLAALLDDNGLSEKVFAQLYDRGMDPHQIVAGKPFIHWYGKTPQQVIDEGVNAEQFRQIVIAHQQRGIAWHTPDDEPNVALPAAEAAELPPAAVTEPTFAGHPLSELAGKSDGELLAIEGIGRATIRKIREAVQAREPQTAA